MTPAERQELARKVRRRSAELIREHPAYRLNGTESRDVIRLAVLMAKTQATKEIAQTLDGESAVWAQRQLEKLQQRRTRQAKVVFTPMTRPNWWVSPNTSRMPANASGVNVAPVLARARSREPRRERRQAAGSNGPPGRPEDDEPPDVVHRRGAA